MIVDMISLIVDVPSRRISHDSIHIRSFIHHRRSAPTPIKSWSQARRHLDGAAHSPQLIVRWKVILIYMVIAQILQ